MGSPPKKSPERALSAYSEQKVAAILEAARALFIQNGYGTTSMEAVALRAGVGKATVYAHFKSKTDLFAAVIVREGGPELHAPVVPGDEDMGTTLGRYARGAFALFMRPVTTAVFRVVAAEAPRFPELGRIFYAEGPEKIQGELAGILARGMDRGVLRREDPHVAACQFLALICGDLQLREFMGVGASVSAKRRDAILSSGLETFIRSYCPGESHDMIGLARAALADKRRKSSARPT